MQGGVRWKPRCAARAEVEWGQLVVTSKATKQHASSHATSRAFALRFQWIFPLHGHQADTIRAKAVTTYANDMRACASPSFCFHFCRAASTTCPVVLYVWHRFLAYTSSRLHHSGSNDELGTGAASEVSTDRARWWASSELKEGCQVDIPWLCGGYALQFGFFSLLAMTYHAIP